MFRNLLVLTIGFMIVFISDPAIAHKKEKIAKHLKDLSCAVNEIARFNGIEWQCSFDENSDALGSLSCNTNQIAEYNGSQWVCADKGDGSPPSSNGAQFVFVGVTSQTPSVQGNVGIGKLNNKCHLEFPGSRICNTKEVIQSINPFPSPLPAGEYWLHHYLIGTNNDFSGLFIGNSDLSCRGWELANGNGFFLFEQGKIKFGGCAIARQVACCGPKAN